VDAGGVDDRRGAQAQSAAAAVGDDSWTRGSAADRERWYTTGFTTGDLRSCDTFA
jgi:uncharacterized protein